jgi:hypothetical protein
MSGNKYQTGAASSRLGRHLQKQTVSDPEPKQEAAPVPEQKERTGRLEDLYERKMYWLRKDNIEKVAAYAYTERISLKEAMDNIFEIAFAKILEDYSKDGKEMLYKPKKGDNKQ